MNASREHFSSINVHAGALDILCKKARHTSVHGQPPSNDRNRMCEADRRDSPPGRAPHKSGTAGWSQRNIWCSLDPIWRDILHPHRNVSSNGRAAGSDLETSVVNPTNVHSSRQGPSQTQTTATERATKAMMNRRDLHVKSLWVTFSTERANDMKGSLSRATFNKYSILIIELPLDAEMGDDRRPIFCRWTGPPMFRPMACATASWKAGLGLSR